MQVELTIALQKNMQVYNKDVKRLKRRNLAVSL